MAGFFTKKQTQSNTVSDNGKRLGCTSCGLLRMANTPKMEPYGGFKKGIMCIGEAPREKDDYSGKPWQGDSGRFLRAQLKDLGIDLWNDCISLNAINCRATNDKGTDRVPKQHEIDCCRRIVTDAIKRYKPKIIILFGTIALESVIGDMWKKKLEGITKWRGWTIPDQTHEAWLCPVFNPLTVMVKNKGEMQTIWKQDLEQAIRLLHRPVPVFNRPKIHYLEEGDLDVFDSILSGSAIAIDYETTGLKPHADGHRIVCASVAVSSREVYTFMMPRKRGKRLPFVRLLLNPNIKKMAHNMKFEEQWSYYRLNGTRVQNWHWCSMQAAHILDNRAGITGLKFQTYVRFGLADYSSEIEPILKGKDPKNANSFNQLEEFCKDQNNAQKVLEYCAMDSALEYKLATLQQSEFKLYTEDLPF